MNWDRRMIVVLILQFLSSFERMMVSAQINLSAASLLPPSGCYTDLKELDNRVANRENIFQVETYTLCPNTIYEIGFLGSSGITEGGFPALTLRQNTRYICGEDGKSSNNCILTGGQIQVLSTFNSFNGESKSNILLKGLTFQKAESAGALLVAPGDVIFEDCIFRVSGIVAFCCH